MSFSQTLDANEAVASVAYRLSETIAIYPITPSSPMAEWCDEWSSKNQPNLWETVPRLVEMQSEAGVAGAVHGMLQTGSLTTTFTCSQGLLLMLPNLYKIVGELHPFCLHVTARSLATHALSIFGDHSDVMACRQTGLSLLASNSVQEAQDLACIAHAAALASRVPVLHFFDGFRTSHEINRIEVLETSVLRAMIDERCVTAFHQRALNPDAPKIRGTAQNPDVFFQAREAANCYHDNVPGIVQGLMDRFEELTGRRYELFQYAGDPQAERVVVAIGSGANTVEETSEMLNAQGAKTGVLKVRLFRPFSVPDFILALPPSVKSIAVLDRTKEPGAVGEPLYLDVVTALAEARVAGLSHFAVEPRVIGGRYGLASKEFTPAMAKAIFDELEKKQPKNHFTVGITDDVTGHSLTVDSEFTIEADDVVRAVFFGLGSDGTVGANKNSIKIIGEETPLHAQGYFVYDSKKSGAVTISHLRFGPNPIRAHYLINRADFVACHHFNLLTQYDILGYAADGATILLNTAYEPDRVWDHLPREVQREMIARKIHLHVIDGSKVAADAGMGRRVNTIMQTCFFALSGVLPNDEAIKAIKKSIEKTYGRKGKAVVEQNNEAVNRALEGLHEIAVPTEADGKFFLAEPVSLEAPDFVQRVIGKILGGQGDLLPVSAFPVDGTWPTGTAKWEKRNIADKIPVWETDLCIQCNKCALVCPHAAIRPKFFGPECLAGAPATFKSVDYRSAEFPNKKYSLQVAPEDCTGCTLCVEVCPVKDKKTPGRKAINMSPQGPLRDAEVENFQFFLEIPSPDRTLLKSEVKSSQFFEPLFEFSGACSGCGETPYLKLLTQLYGDRAYIANATGCSSIFGGNLPTTPYTTDQEGRGPAWSNSLFEDNAEYGYGIRFSLDKQAEIAEELLVMLAPQVGDTLVESLLGGRLSDEVSIAAQRQRVDSLKSCLASIASPEAKRLVEFAHALINKSVWIVGGDGWAYDIGFGGLDHIFSLGANVNILVLDTEVYSNTGGQQSKSTPMGASARFATSGKTRPKKDLGLIAMTYGSVYVARVAMGAKDSQTLKVFAEAEQYPGTSLIIAYSHCIAHGYDLGHGLQQQKLAVECGAWPLFRFDPRRSETGLPPLQLDSTAPKVGFTDYLRNEMRFRHLEKSDPDGFRLLQKSMEADAYQRWSLYEQLAAIHT